MVNSLKGDLQNIGSYFSDSLISADNFTRISKIADLLPSLPNISEAGFECHLSQSILRTDFLIPFTSLNQGRTTLFDSSEALANLPSNSSVWKKIHNFSACWANPKSLLYDNVDNIWLEFDLDKEFSRIPEPSLFFGCKNIIGKNKNNIAYELQWVADKALNFLLNCSLQEEAKQQLSSCFQLLPSEAEVFQIGIMLPRKSESKAIRLCIEGINSKQILMYLKDIGWSDSSNKLNCLLTELSSIFDVIRLNISIEDRIFPKIGLECYLHRQPKNSSKWKLVKNYLVQNKLCTVEKANALLDWSGYSVKEDNSTLLQDNFVKGSMPVPPNLSKSIIVRLLHHIKIVYQPNQPLQAKAYLWFSHCYLTKNGSFQKPF